MHHAAVTVGHDLKFDVVRIQDQFLDVNRGVAERFVCLETRTVKSGN